MIDTLATVTTEAPAILRRNLPRRSQRRVAFYHPGSREIALETSRITTLTLEGARASDLLAFVADLPITERPRTVFLCGGDSSATTPPVAWWQEPLAHGWTLRQWHNAADRRTGVYELGEGRDGITVDLRMAAPWFGGAGAALDPATCIGAWRQTQRQLRGAFGQHVALMTTPAMTGLDLFEASLPYGAAVETLPDELRDHLASVSTQGRRELFSPFTRTVADLWELDARWMYAACLHNLPVGPVVRDNVTTYAPHVPGFYLVLAQVPAAWSHIGLLPDLASFDSATPIQYPRRPRKRFWSWATGAEVELALAHGWRLAIHQRILWPETGKRGSYDVAKTWVTKLRALREVAQFGALASRPESELVTVALRHVLIDTVGRWYSREREEHGILPLDRINDLPSGAIPHIERDLVLWERAAQIRPEFLRYAHPEWAATVWGRARARLAAQALTMPFHSLVALRTDGIWTTANPYDLALNDTDPRPGAWRVKSYLQGPDFWPRDEAQLIALMRRARGHDGEEG